MEGPSGERESPSRPALSLSTGRPAAVDVLVGAIARAELRTAYVLTGDALATIDELRAVDGALHAATEKPGRRAVEAVRCGKGPYFLEYRTYRFRAHSMYDAELYRSKDEVAAWKQRDPILLLQQTLRTSHGLNDAEWSSMESAVASEIDEAVAFAEGSPWEPVEDLTKDVLTDVSGQT